MKNTTLVIILTEMSKPEHPVHGPGLQVFHKHPRWECNTSHIVAMYCSFENHVSLNILQNWSCRSG